MKHGKRLWRTVVGMLLLLYAAGCIFYAVQTHAHGEEDYKERVQTIMEPMKEEIQSQTDRIEHTAPPDERWKATPQLTSYLSRKHMDLYTLDTPSEYKELHKQLHKQMAAAIRAATRAESFYLEDKPAQAHDQLETLNDAYGNAAHVRDEILAN